MNFIFISFLLFAFVAADSSIEEKIGEKVDELGHKVEEKFDATVEKVEKHVDTLMNSICSASPERPLKSIEEEIKEAWNSVVKAFTLVSGVPKVIYDETVQEAVNSFEDIKKGATNMVTDIKIELPQIPKAVDLDFGELGVVHVPLS